MATKDKVKTADVVRSLILNPQGKLRAALPGNEELVQQVRKASGNKAFDAKQLAWYKNRAKNGKLSKGRAAKAVKKGKAKAKPSKRTEEENAEYN